MTMYTFPPAPPPRAPHSHPHPHPHAHAHPQQAALEAHAAQMGSFARRLEAQAQRVAEQARRMEEEQRRAAAQASTSSAVGGHGPLPPFLFDPQGGPAALEWARLLHSGHSPQVGPTHPLSAHAADHARTKASLHQRREEERLRAQAEAERRRRVQEAEDRALAVRWEEYEARWAEMALLSPSSPGGTGTVGMSFTDLPWPCHPAPSGPHELQPIKIQRFILSPSHSSILGPKERVRQALLRWHPDKFEGRWMRRVKEHERERVRQGVLAVVSALGEVQEEMTRRGVWSP